MMVDDVAAMMVDDVADTMMATDEQQQQCLLFCLRRVYVCVVPLQLQLNVFYFPSQQY
jgi:hypothetical protein